MRLLRPTISVLALVCAVRTAPLTLPSHALSTSDLRVRANAEAYPSSPKHDLSTQREVSPSLRNARTQSTHQYAAVKRRSFARLITPAETRAAAARPESGDDTASERSASPDTHEHAHHLSNTDEVQSDHVPMREATQEELLDLVRQGIDLDDSDASLNAHDYHYPDLPDSVAHDHHSRPDPTATGELSFSEALANFDVALKGHLTGNFRSSNPTDQPPPLPGPVLKWYTSCFRTIYPEASGSGGTPYDLIQPNVPRYQCPKLIAVTFPKGRGKKRKYSAPPKGGEMPPREVELQVSQRLFGFPDYVEFIAFEGNYVQGETQFEYRVKDEDDDKRTDHKFSKPEPIDTPKDKGGKPPPCDFDTLMKEYYQRPRASKAGPSAAPSAGHRA